MGLAISKRIVEAMGGELHLESESGKGSRFWFSVPLKHGEAITVQPTQSTSSVHAKVFKVLLVEDNPVNSMVAEGFLVHMGHEVLTAKDGAEAQVLFAQQQFDIALLDINLPDCNGVELLAQLKCLEVNRAEHKSTPMIAVSAHVFNEEVEQYLTAGFDGYLPKPIVKEDLEQIIQRSLEGKPLPLTQDSNPSNHVESKCTVIDNRIVLADIDVLGHEKMQQIVELFASSASEALLELQHHADNGEQIKLIVHKLKGSAGSLGLDALFDACLEIEKNSAPEKVYQMQRVKLEKAVALSVQALRALFNVE